MKRVNLLGIPVDLATMSETVDIIDSRIAARMSTQHAVVNVAKLVSAQSDLSLAEAIRNCDIVNIDGMGVVWGARLLGYEVPERVTGIDLFERLLEVSARRGYPVFFLGATSEVLERAVERCRARYRNLDIAGFHHGYFWDDERAVVEKIKASGARLLFVAITSPKKENFINAWRRELGVDFVMGVGGTFDVISGKIRRAPAWMQKSGLEWLFRAVQEPGRMGKRYLVTNSAFLWLLAKARFSLRRG